MLLEKRQSNKFWRISKEEDMVRKDVRETAHAFSNVGTACDLSTIRGLITLMSGVVSKL